MPIPSEITQSSKLGFRSVDVGDVGVTQEKEDNVTATQEPHCMVDKARAADTMRTRLVRTGQHFVEAPRNTLRQRLDDFFDGKCTLVCSFSLASINMEAG